jgi:hypothetical protein
MPEQLLTFELEKLSQGRQGAILDNCYFAPATDGNAVTQVCTFPKLEPDGKWSKWGDWLQGCEVKSVANCYHWQVIYGKKGTGFFLYVYDTRKESIGKPAEDKTYLFNRAGFMDYVEDNYFCAKPFWTLRPVQGSSDSRCIAILINEYIWVVDIEFSMTEPVVIKGEFHYIVEDMYSIINYSGQAFYMDVYNQQQGPWSSNTLDMFGNLLPAAWNQLKNFSAVLGNEPNITMSRAIKDRLEELRKDFEDWIITKKNGYYFNCLTIYALNSSHYSTKLQADYINNVQPHIHGLLQISTGSSINLSDLDSAINITTLAITFYPDGKDAPYSWQLYSNGSSNDIHSGVTMYVTSTSTGLFGDTSITGYINYGMRLDAGGNSSSSGGENFTINGNDVVSSNYRFKMSAIRNYLEKMKNEMGELDGTGMRSLTSVAQTTISNCNNLDRICKEFLNTKINQIRIAAQAKFHPDDVTILSALLGDLSASLQTLSNSLALVSNYSRNYLNVSAIILLSDIPGIVARANTYLANVCVAATKLESIIEKIVALMLRYNIDYQPTFFDVLNSMLIVIATDNRFYYSDAGTTNIEGDNFFAAQSGGGQSIPTECYRLGNRLCLMTEDTVEFWDGTLDYQQPLSPQYGHNVYSYKVIKDTAVVYDDTIYCLAKSNLLPYCSAYRISKNGAMEKISYPELDAYINARSFGSVKASLIELSKKPLVSFWLGDKTVNYDITGNTFCLSDEILMYMNMPDGAGLYLRWSAAEAGSLINRAETVAKLSTPPMAMGRSSKSLKLIQVEVDNHDVEKLVCEIDRQGDHAFSTTRTVLFKPGNHRNMLAKYENWGMINNNRMTLTWKGDLKINRAQWVIE